MILNKDNSATPAKTCEGFHPGWKCNSVQHPVYRIRHDWAMGGVMVTPNNEHNEKGAKL